MTMLKDFAALTIKGVSHRPVRSWLTILGIVIGITLVVVILSLGQGIQFAVAQRLQMFGSRLIVVYPGKETNPIIAFIGGQKFRESDLLALENIDGVKLVVPELVGTANVEFQGEKKSSLLHATSWKGTIEIIQESKGFRLADGRWPLNDEVSEIVLGDRAAHNLFKKEVKVGDEIIIKSKRMRVVGITTPIGEQMADNLIFISIDVFRNLMGMGAVAGSANVKVNPGANIDLVARQIKFQLSKQDVVRDFSVLTPEKATQIIGDVLLIIELTLSIIGLVSLLVGAVGIMNTMYTSVLERTRQIGIMKAIGASNEAILSLFLIESGMIGLVGGIFGVVFGLVAAYFINLVAVWYGIRGLFAFASLDIWGLFAILVITFITGVIAGVLPARQAAKLEPAEALRYE